MHNRLTADRQRIKVLPYSPRISRAAALVEWVFALENELDASPKLYVIEQEHTLWIHFENSCLECEWFLEEYAMVASFISKEYPSCVCGTAEGKEPAEIEVRYCEQDSMLEITKTDISGDNFSVFTDLCLRVQMENPDELREMYLLLCNLSPRQSYLVVNRCPLTKLWFEGCPDDDPYTAYRYISLQDNGGEKSEFWKDITVGQRKELWLMLLRENISVREFEYVIDSLNEGVLADSFRWELALRQAISEEKVEISFSQGEFRVLDSGGKRIRFDYATGTGAERLFLKIIFPITPTRR